MNNVHVTKKFASATVSALLLFGAVAAGLVGVPQNATAQAAVTINSSADSFYGPGFIRVLITNPSLDDSGDTITPTVEARDGSSVLGSDSPTIEAIGSSGTFEFFITTSAFQLTPANPTKTTANGGVAGAGNGPFIVRAFTGSGDSLNEAAGVDVNGDATPAGSNTYGLSADPANIDNFRILYGGQTLVIDFEDATAELTSDRTEAGDDNEIILEIVDQDSNLDPTLVDEFDINTGFGVPEDLLDSTNPVTYGDGIFRETGQNTGIFQLAEPITVNGGTNELAATLPTGNSFTLMDHSVYEAVTGASVPFDAIVEESSTDSVSITLRNRDGSLELLTTPTLTDGLQVQLNDPDRNISTEDDDSIAPAQVQVTVGAESGDISFTETDDNTGQFLPDYSQDKITIQVGPATDVDGPSGVITLTVADIEAGVDIVFLYTDPAFQSNEEFEVVTEVDTTLGQLSANVTSVGINEDAEITLTEPDLNINPNTIETYNVSGGNFLINGETVGTFTISFNGNNVPANTVSTTFIETGPDTGVFVADDIDISDIDAEVGPIDDGEEINFEYFDLLDDDDSDIDIRVGMPDAGIDVDKNTIPVPLSTDPVTVIISVVDPTANTNPGSVETVDLLLTDIRIRDGDGVDTTGDLADIEELTGHTDDITLTETGANTGIFEEDLELQPTSTDLDRLIDTRVTFEYDGETVSVTYRAFDGTITVNPSAVGTGDEFVVTVSDQDENKDPEEVDELQVVAESIDDDIDTQTLTLEETGPDTGVFTDTVEVGVDIDIADVGAGDFASAIELTYTDIVTSAGDENEEREATVRIATAGGQISVTPEVVGPGTEVTVTIIDTDLNESPNSRDDIDDDGTVEIASSDGETGNLGFRETAPNSGIFEATIQFEPRTPGEDGELGGSGDDWTYEALPGDTIAIRYEDESNASGNNVLISTTFTVLSEDPTMTAATQTVQVGGTIELTIADSDANRDGDSLDSVDVEVTSDSDPVGFTLAALETSNNSGNFTVNIPTSQSLSSGSINVATGDNVYLEYTDEFPADYEDRAETVLNPSRDFVLIVPVGQATGDANATTPEAPILQDISGNELTEVTVGQQVILSSNINNNGNFPQDFAGIVEVRNEDGFTVYLQWQTGTLNPNGTTNIGLSFVPDAPGEYTTRVFVLSSIENPTILSPVVESTFTVS